jgi:hypothetical protein
MIVPVSAISSNTAGIRAEASSSNRVPFSLSLLISDFNASGLAIVIPIPMAAEFGLFGSIEVNLLAEPRVNLSSDMGSTIAFGDRALVGKVFDLGTAV